MSGGTPSPEGTRKSAPTAAENGSPGRLVPLDAFRGLTIAGMVLVNMPGNWAHTPTWLRHAPGHGCAPADLVFPCFLFIAGVSMHLKARRCPDERIPAPVLWQRCAVLVAAGIALNALPTVLDMLAGHGPADFSHLRLTGVLQRIGLATLLAGLVQHRLSTRGLAGAGTIVLLGYRVLLCARVPGTPLSPEDSLPALIDRLVLTPAHMYRVGPCDPEGLLATLPAAVSVLAGVLAGRWLCSRPGTRAAALGLIPAGCAGIATGLLWGCCHPINKTLWTGPFVLLSTGWALILFGTCMLLFDASPLRSGARGLAVLGRNALAAYIAVAILARVLLAVPAPGLSGPPVSLHACLYRFLFLSWAPPGFASVSFSLFWLTLVWLLLCVLHGRELFLTLP